MKRSTPEPPTPEPPTPEPPTPEPPTPGSSTLGSSTLGSSTLGPLTLIAGESARQIIADWLDHPQNPALTGILIDLLRDCVSGGSPQTVQDRGFQAAFRHIRIDGSHWLWVGAVDSHGRPMVRRGTKLLLVHRYLWEIAGHGEVGQRRLVNICGQSLCVRPEHHTHTSTTSRSQRAAMQTRLVETRLEDAMAGLPEPQMAVIEARGKTAERRRLRESARLAGGRLRLGLPSPGRPRKTPS